MTDEERAQDRQLEVVRLRNVIQRYDNAIEVEVHKAEMAIMAATSKMRVAAVENDTTALIEAAAEYRAAIAYENAFDDAVQRIKDSNIIE